MLAFSGLQYQAFELGFKRTETGAFEMTATGISEVIIATGISLGTMMWFYRKSSA